LVC
jgi:hypothetical protein